MVKCFLHLLRFGIVASVLAIISMIVPVASAQTLTQGYETEETLQNGMIVQLKAGAGNKVVPLTQEKELDMLGVVISSTESLVSLSDPTKQQVYVTNSGQYAVLVSTQNGTIKTGDPIAVSAIKGVGMKSDTKHQVILGKALQGFAGGNNAESKVTIKNDIGTTTVALARILVDIKIARNPAYSGDNVTGVPTVLAKAARAVSSKPITALRLYACIAVLFVALAVAGGILFAGARSGMMAVGRNPLAKKSIVRSMVTVILMAMIVVIIGVVAVYLLLKL